MHDFFSNDDVADEVVRLVRTQRLDGEELGFLFAEAGHDAETLPGVDFATAMVAFEAAFLAAAATEAVLQSIIEVRQGWAQTAQQREMVGLMRQMVAQLQSQPARSVGIEAGSIVADNVVSGTQIIYQWDGETKLADWERGYLKKLIGYCNRLDLADVDERFLEGDEDEVQLSDVFTGLYVARGKQVIKRGARASVQEALEGHDDEAPWLRLPLTAVSTIGALDRLVVLGHPGGGKSSLVNYLATACAQQRLDKSSPTLPDWPDTALLPVRIILRQFAVWLVDEVSSNIPYATAGLVWRYLAEKLLLEWGTPEAFHHIRRTLQTEGGVIFFDGLDEVPESIDEARRTLIKETIVDFARPLDRCKVVVTCREYAYAMSDSWRLPERSFPVINLALFGETQIRDFAATWYRVTGPREGWDADKQEHEATRLADAVLAKPHLRELGQYPLLMTLMARVHVRYDLPDNRADLYDRAVDLLLAHWENRLVRQTDGSRRMELGIIARLNLRQEDVRSVLQAMAFAAHERQEGQQDRESEAADIGRDELWEGLLPLVDSYDRAKEVTDYIQQRSGLLLAKEGFTYGFPHRTFQEFLAAAHAWSLPEDPVEVLFERLERDTPWWRQIFLLAAGQKRNSAYLVKSLVDRLVQVKSADAAASEWQLTRATLAAQTIHETNFNRFVLGKEADHPYVLLLERVRARLRTILVAEASLPPVQRAEAGRALGGWIEDRRRGVGVDRETGLPDIWWGEEVAARRYMVGGDGEALRSFEKREIQIKWPFYFARYPVTNAQFQCFVDASKEEHSDPRWWNGLPVNEQQFSEPSFPYANHPRETVSWYQAIAFCRWLTAKLADKLPAGAVIDLPHEYEWEVAARWPNGRFFPWGNRFDAERANTSEGALNQTTAVGMYPSSGNEDLKLYDMSGNVFEWCCNKYRKPDESRIDQSGDPRVVRGGSWSRDQYYARGACRAYYFPDDRSRYFGFRIVLRLPPIGKP